jgi:DNA-binding transcriptional LysR family regulator
MASKQVDLAVMVALSGHREFGLFPLFEDELAFIVAAQHPWAQSGRAPSGPAVAEETLILSMKTSLTFRLISQYFRDQGMQLGQFMELTSLGAIKELVKIGAGAAILAPWTVRADLDDGSLVMVPIGKRRLKRKWGVVYRKGRNLSLGEDAFVGLCRSVTENFGAPVDV